MKKAKNASVYLNTILAVPFSLFMYFCMIVSINILILRLENTMSTKNELSRITIDIPKTDHKRLKTMAGILGTSMRELIIEAIEKHIYSKNIPNKKTLKAIHDIEKGKGLMGAKNADDLFKKLGI